MAAPRTVARSLRRTAAQLAKIPDAAIGEIASDVIDEAVSVGGTFTRRRYRMYAEARVSGGARTRRAVVFGRPAGFWAIRTFGRAAMRARRGGFPLGRSGEFRQSAGPAGPARHGRWDEVTDYANERAPQLFADAVAEAVTNG